MSMADAPTASPLARLVAAIAFAVLGVTIAWFAVPLLQRSDALLRDGVRATATVVSIESSTCFDSRFRNRHSFPCDAVTGEWIHDGVTYRTIIGHHQRPHAFARGRQLTVVFVPDPAAAAGRADLHARPFGIDGSEPVPERPIYLAVIALACLMCLPLFQMLLRLLRAATS
jgi:hypothetical protein